MNRYLFYVILAIFGFNCASNTEEEKGVFPENLVVKKTSKHQRIPGTNLFAIIPETYKFVKPFRFVKSPDEFIILSKFQMPFQYDERKIALKAKDPEAETLLLREATFNNEKALFRESLIVEKNQHFYLLNYGNEENSYMILSQGLLDSAASRQELLDIIKSVCEDPTVQYDPLETSSFTFDESITSFKIAQANINDFRFTANGQYKSNNKIVNSILVNELGPTTYENRVQLMEYWAGTYLNSNKNKQKNKFKPAKIGPYDVMEFETDFSLNGVDGKVYFAILSDEKQQTMKFTGIAFEEIENNIKEYKETVKSIKFK